MLLIINLRRRWQLICAQRANKRKRIEDIRRIEAQKAAEEHR